MASHLRDKHRDSWDRFSIYLTIGDAHLKELETLILRIVKPTGNKVQGKFPRSEDLRRKFASEVRFRLKNELSSLMGRSYEEERRPTRKPAKVKGTNPVLAGLSDGPMPLRARYKGKLIKARVRQDGKISLSGKLFTSPSLAGAAACNRRTCNGWTFWQFERSKGEWVSLDELRK